jgi:hypothetical protein
MAWPVFYLFVVQGAVRGMLLVGVITNQYVGTD